MRPNSSLAYDMQCVHYAERRVSMHGTWMEMHDNRLKITWIVRYEGGCFWDPSILIVGFCCGDKFSERMEMGLKTILRVVGLCYKERVIYLLLPFFSLFLHMVYSGYVLPWHMKWVLI
ncbi:hypothetical protein NE237_001074 [Protea cynaroides]|uniref:Uncharacterized protein n=1 Tax=Protea cynaroides TaxID=273540 RepID=A0A9Q0KSG8_9MAGN|nr:hypothetical protein NE237_001074 [Protea cynaroides]